MGSVHAARRYVDDCEKNRGLRREFFEGRITNFRRRIRILREDKALLKGTECLSKERKAFTNQQTCDLP